MLFGKIFVVGTDTGPHESPPDALIYILYLMAFIHFCCEFIIFVARPAATNE